MCSSLAEYKICLIYIFNGQSNAFHSGGGGASTSPSLKQGVQSMMKKLTNQIKSFGKMRGQTDLRTIRKGVNQNKNQGEYWYKMLQNGQITDFGDKLDQF